MLVLKAYRVRSAMSLSTDIAAARHLSIVPFIMLCCSCMQCCSLVHYRAVHYACMLLKIAWHARLHWNIIHPQASFPLCFEKVIKRSFLMKVMTVFAIAVSPAATAITEEARERMVAAESEARDETEGLPFAATASPPAAAPCASAPADPAAAGLRTATQWHSICGSIPFWNDCIVCDLLTDVGIDCSQHSF